MTSEICTTLGNFIIDNFDVSDAAGFDVSKVPKEMEGGGGLYALIGARIWCNPEEVGFIIERGSDWTDNLQRRMESYGNCFLYRDTPDRLTTRSINTFHGSHRDFDYLTPKRQLSPLDLLDSPFYSAEWLHIVCTPDQALDTISQLRDMHWMPKICYEPIPYCCTPSNRRSLLQVLPHVDLFSPNHVEASSFLQLTEKTWPGTREEIEDLCKKYLELGAKDKIVIRCGPMGACGVDRKTGSITWVPAYHYQDPSILIDSTGCGNSMLVSVSQVSGGHLSSCLCKGGMMVGLSKSDASLQEGLLYGSISASFSDLFQFIELISMLNEAQ